MHTQAPLAPFQVQMQPPQISWSTGLCDRSDGCRNWCITCFCPYITFGRIAEIVDRGSPSCAVSGGLYFLLMHTTGCPWMYSWTYRSKLRKQYGLLEAPCSDCCVSWCCERCSLRQMYRELQRRGFDISIGWQGNMARQGQTTTAPPVYQGMKR